MQLAYPEIQALGANLVAISPQLPEGSRSTVEQHALEFAVLSDVGNRVAHEFGLVFEVVEPLRGVYRGFGLDFPAINGDDSFGLPLTATYVIGTDHTVAYAFVDPDYCKRLEPTEIIRVLKTLKGPD